MTLRGVLHTNCCSSTRPSTPFAARRLTPAAAVLAWCGVSHVAVAQDIGAPPGVAPSDAPPSAAPPDTQQGPEMADSPDDQGPAADEGAGADSSIDGSSAAQGPPPPLDSRVSPVQPLTSLFGNRAGANVADTGIVADPIRAEGLKQGLGLSGASGLMHVQSASAGTPGTFRLSLMTGIYSGSGFLCPPCTNDGPASLPDKVDRVAAHFFLSATPADFLEVYGGIYSYSTSTNRPTNQLKQVVGDWSVGAKALFLKPEADQVLSLGGSADLGFATGSGQVGVSGIDSVNLGVRVVASADFNQLRSRRLPLKVHANLGYLFDNSSNLIEDYERNISGYIERIERFSLDINRVDSIPFAVGAELTLAAVRPFAEWSVDIPITHLRGDFRCTRTIAELYPGDACMQGATGFSSSPSRLTVGARVMPWELASWWMDGIALVGAADIGTGAVSDFLVEVAPELPWNVWFGLSLAADTKPQVVIETVELPAPELPPEALRVHGIVIEQGSNTAIADALIRFDGRNMTGLISTPQGDFLTSPLDPGLYTFRINAEGYKEGTCSVEVLAPEYATEPLGMNASPQTGQPALRSSLASANSPEDLGPPALRCELEPIPLVSNVNGRVQHGTSGAPVGITIASITDVLGRHLEIQVDAVGAFRFKNVPPGAARITLSAQGFLTSVTEMAVEAPQEINRTFVLYPVPEQATVQVNGESLELDTPFVFEAEVATLSPASLRTIQELAAFLVANPELGSLEVQGHSDSPGEEQLSAARANALRNALVLHGLPSGRITAEGFGNSVPTSKKNEANERIVFKLTKTKSTTLPF